jgi:hypothetical protein
MHTLGCLLVAAALTADVPGDPGWSEIEEQEPDFVVATAGLQPFTPETNYLSLKDYWRRFHHRKPDLVITKVVLVPAKPKVGEPIQAVLYYKNIGGKDARSFYLRQAPGPLGAGGFGLGGDHASLSAGQEKKYYWGALRATKAGTFTLSFDIDPRQTVDESNRRNNRFDVTVRIVRPRD